MHFNNTLHKKTTIVHMRAMSLAWKLHLLKSRGSAEPQADMAMASLQLMGETL